MSTNRTAYHLLFAELLKERAPPGFQVIPELTLTTEPQRADFLLLRQESPVRHDDEARTLRRLWPLLPGDTVVEYKSPTRPVRRGDVVRLLGYGAQYHASEAERLRSRSDLCLVLVVAAITPTLDNELAVLGWSRRSLGDGYYRLDSQPYAGLVVVVDEVADAERDELLELVGDRTMMTDEARRWYRAHSPQGWEAGEMEKLEGWEELEARALARVPARLRLKGLSAEERLEGLSPEERLKGLSPEEQVLAMSDDLLRRLPPEFLQTLPQHVREEIQRRLALH